MSLQDLQARDMRRIVADLPMAFTFNGTDYTGTISGINATKPLEIGGFEELPEITLIVNLKDAAGGAVFSTRPEVNDRITIDDIDYRVMRTEFDPLAVALQMDLKTAER